MNQISNLSLAFDDVLLIPNYSEVSSRKKVDLTMYVNGAALLLPIIGAPMNTVCGPEMCIALWNAGGIGILHRYNSTEEQVRMYQQVATVGTAFCAVGCKREGRERAYRLWEAGCNLFCIDVAHGHHLLVKEMLSFIRNHPNKEFANSYVMAGNVATAQGSLDLVEWGADSVRGSVGGGSACTTRRVTGFGNSTLQWVLDTKDRFMSKGITAAIIADGGIRNSGDAMKCFAAGADAIMCGSLLSGTDEAPGEILVDKDTSTRYKVYQGMASFNAMTDWDSTKTDTTPEGVATRVPYKGPVNDVLQGFKGGLQSACSYAGLTELNKAHSNIKLVRVSESGLRESHPHILGKP
jgi:IMP dehydrogenase